MKYVRYFETIIDIPINRISLLASVTIFTLIPSLPKVFDNKKTERWER